MEDFGQVSGENLQRLIRAGGQVVDPDVFILAAGGDHVPETTKKLRLVSKLRLDQADPVLSNQNSSKSLSHKTFQLKLSNKRAAFFHSRLS